MIDYSKYGVTREEIHGNGCKTRFLQTKRKEIAYDYMHVKRTALAEELGIALKTLEKYYRSGTTVYVHGKRKDLREDRFVLNCF